MYTDADFERDCLTAYPDHQDVDDPDCPACALDRIIADRNRWLAECIKSGEALVVQAEAMQELTADRNRWKDKAKAYADEVDRLAERIEGMLAEWGAEQ